MSMLIRDAWSEMTPRNTHRSTPLSVPIWPSILSALFSAVVTCGLLFIDGSFVLAAVSVATENGMGWFDDARATQVAVFVLSPVLVILQWMMIDYLLRHVRFRRSLPDRPGE